ncbi:MAG TPA: M23 family metallopeptidase [Bryobacteraceae bacterium]|nr:M23 family metallopeptidase [Bryobacteraceae bacterium]
MKKVVIAVAALVLLPPLVLLYSLSSGSTLQVDPEPKVLGADSPVTVRVANPHGIRRFTATIEQDGASHKVFEWNQPAHRFWFFGKNEPAADIRFTAGTKRAPAVKEGKARLTVEATANDFRGATERRAYDVVVNTRPPRVVADGFQHYINHGGAELVTFRVSGYWTEAGVRVGPYTFRSFPVPGGAEGERFSLFAFPWDVPLNTTPIVYARNPAGTEAKAQFWFKVFPKTFRMRDLEIPESFVEKVVNEIDANGSGELLPRFLKINGEMRRANNKVLADLRLKTEDRFYWSGPFHRYGKTEAFFADTRDYIYQGKKVDRQTHLGFDLSDVQQAPIVAANDGKVVFADYLGIYGNCVVIDHGYGLQSIYGHMSQIAVKPGDMVKKEQQIGRSGATGMAGGDHLHFSMQVDGVQVQPIEWWDDHWIQDRVLAKLPKK